MRNLKLWLYGQAVMFIAADLMETEVNGSDDEELKEGIANLCARSKFADILIGLRDVGFAKRSVKKMLREYNKLMLWARERVKCQETQEEGA